MWLASVLAGGDVAETLFAGFVEKAELERADEGRVIGDTARADAPATGVDVEELGKLCEFGTLCACAERDECVLAAAAATAAADV